MPTPAGCNQYNVLGATDAISHDVITVCNTIYTNALSVCELLEQIALQFTIVLDNARYQHYNYVMKKAESLGIELLFLPSYSPNLNIIERLWKWAKNDCLNCKYYSKVTEFTEAINRSLMKTKNKENKKELSLNFQ
jgi:transposase